MKCYEYSRSSEVFTNKQYSKLLIKIFTHLFCDYALLNIVICINRVDKYIRYLLISLVLIDCSEKYVRFN